MIRGLAFVLLSVLVIAAGQLTSDIGTAFAEGPSSSVEGNVPSAITQAARDVARYAVDASREAFQTAEAAARAANSALSEAALVVRRETNRARNAAQRAREEVDEATDRETVSRVPASSPGTVQSLRRRQQAEVSFARGSGLLEARRYQEARNQFAEAVALYPEYDEARSLLAWSEYFLGDFRRAVFTFKTALRRPGMESARGWPLPACGRRVRVRAGPKSGLRRRLEWAWLGDVPTGRLRARDSAA